MSEALASGGLLTGRYRLETELADHGGARSFRATDEVLNRHVVVDLVDSDDPRAEAMLAAARSAATCAEARFVRVLDAATEDGVAYCVREWVNGSPLARILAAGPLSGHQAGWIGRELAEAIAACHGQGLAHGCLDLSTVYVTPTAALKVTGLATEAVVRDGSVPSPADDVRDVGRVLYAALVARWPGGSAFGLGPAPTEHDRVLSPRQVRAGVPRTLDVICDRVLNSPPRHHETPIGSAPQLVDELVEAVGRTALSERIVQTGDLELWPYGHAPAGGTQPAGPPDDPGDATQLVIGGPDGPSTGPVARIAAPAVDDAQPAGATGSALDPAGSTGGPAPLATPHRQPQDRMGGAPPAYQGGAGAPPEGRPRRWKGPALAVLAVLAVIAIVALAVVLGRGGLGIGGSGRPDSSSAPATSTSAGASATAAAAPYRIATARDFDPVADKGSGSERSEEVPRSYDGNASTAWDTQEYDTATELKDTKPGVGVWYDLGSPKRISKVTVTVATSGTTAVDVRVPTAANATTAPGTVKAWTSIASNAAAHGATVFTPTKPVTARFVLVYLTKLPQVGDHWQGRIYEIAVQ